MHLVPPCAPVAQSLQQRRGAAGNESRPATVSGDRNLTPQAERISAGSNRSGQISGQSSQTMLQITLEGPPVRARTAPQVDDDGRREGQNPIRLAFFFQTPAAVKTFRLKGLVLHRLRYLPAEGLSVRPRRKLLRRRSLA